MTQLLGCEPAKDGLDVGRKGGHVGHHHHHISGVQRRVGVEPGQQLVMQHLDFALRAVGGDEQDGVVIFQHNRAVRQRLQIQNG